MTDHEMHARLTAAGDRWRAQNTVAVVDDSPAEEFLVQRPAPHRSRSRLLAGASAAVVAAALVVGGVLAVNRHDGARHAPGPARPAPALRDSSWTLLALTDGTGTALPKVDRRTVLTFASNGTIRTDDQCGNDISSAITVTGTTFRYTKPLYLSAMGCADPVLGRGGVVLDTILAGDTVHWTISGRLLVLTVPGYRGRAEYWRTTDPRAALTGTTWHLTTYDESTQNFPAGTISTHTPIGGWRLRFGTHQVTLSTACYVITGRWRADGATAITVSGSSGAEPANVRCDITRQYRNEQLTLAKLLSNGAVAAVAARGTLLLSHYNLGATFTRASAGALAGATWSLSDTERESTSGGSSSGSGASAVTRSDLSFTTDGRFTLAHRCYSRTGSYTVAGDTITLRDVTGGTALPCASNTESPAGQAEDAFVDAVLGNGAATITRDGNALRVTRGGHTAEFARR